MRPFESTDGAKHSSCGAITPVIDIRLKLGIAWPVDDNFIVTTNPDIADRALGIIVDAGSDVIELGRYQIGRSPRGASQSTPVS